MTTKQTSAPIRLNGPLHRLAKSRGFTIIGEGIHKTVMASPNHPEVVFLCFLNDGEGLGVLNATYDYSRGEGRRDPFIPRMLDRAVAEVDDTEILMVKSEMLYPRRRKYRWEIPMHKISSFTASYLSNKRPDFLMWAEEKWKLSYSLPEEMESSAPGSADSLIAFTEYISSAGVNASFDWSLDNVLQRANGQLVFNDIWC